MVFGGWMDADGCDGFDLVLQKYPGFADRVHEGLTDIFGDKGK